MHHVLQVSTGVGTRWVAARRDPARLLRRLDDVRLQVYGLGDVLGSNSTYHVTRRLDDARKELLAAAHEVDRVRRMLRTGWCLPHRWRARYRHSVSVQSRAWLTDGGLGDLSRSLRRTAATVRRLDRTPFYVLVRDSGLTATRDRMAGHLDSLSSFLDRIAVDVTGADLSRAGELDLGMLRNVIWSDRTTWPPSLAEPVRSHSVEISPGVHQVTRRALAARGTLG